MPANYVLLERIELNASAASVTFANIPQSGYTDLKVVISARVTSGSAVANSIFMKMNSLTTSIYSQRAVEGNGAAASSFTQSGVDNAVRVAITNGSSSTASTFSSSEIYIPNYTSSNNKSVSIDTVAETNATTQYMNMLAYLVSSTAAISSLTFSTEASAVAFDTNSTFSLYGLAATGTTPVIAPKASGGNITTDGTYWIHTFLSSGTFTPNQALTCDYLVVAGGAGGGDEYAGGGGAGGLRSTVTATGGGGSLESALSVASGTAYTITVGAGGAGSTTAAVDGTNGSNSVFSTITSTGGGGGGSEARVGVAGGSGGGGSYLAAGGARTTNQGFAGGSGSPTVASVRGTGGGGGGAGAVGTNAPNNDNGGNGGNGVAVSITGTSVTYAGGGGGGIGTNSTGAVGSGGSGGGGTGAQGTSAGTAGTTNTGSGGGGGGGSSTGGGSGGNGGSGVVIIRYLVA